MLINEEINKRFSSTYETAWPGKIVDHERTKRYRFALDVVSVCHTQYTYIKRLKFIEGEI